MMNQYTTTNGKVVTEYPDMKLWIVSNGKRDHKFLSFVSFMRYMTK